MVTEDVGDDAVSPPLRGPGSGCDCGSGFGMRSTAEDPEHSLRVLLSKTQVDS